MDKFKGLMTSLSCEYSTPQWLFDELNNEFQFTLDACATRENHKCERYYTIEDGGLNKSWKNETVFMNPPYGKVLKLWLEKAYTEFIKGSNVVCLIPARTDTIAWHSFVMKSTEIRFIKGRLKFGDSKNSAPFPSCIVIFDGSKL